MEEGLELSWICYVGSDDTALALVAGEARSGENLPKLPPTVQWLTNRCREAQMA